MRGGRQSAGGALDLRDVDAPVRTQALDVESLGPVFGRVLGEDLVVVDVAQEGGGDALRALPELAPLVVLVAVFDAAVLDADIAGSGHNLLQVGPIAVPSSLTDVIGSRPQPDAGGCPCDTTCRADPFLYLFWDLCSTTFRDFNESCDLFASAYCAIL